MKCPHCLDSFHPQWSAWTNFVDYEGDAEFSAWEVRSCICPTCYKRIVEFHTKERDTGRGEVTMVYPKGIARAPLHSSVDPKFSEDYKEACLVLPDSAKASAALSRTCLQNILREKAGVKPSDLSTEIQEVLDSGKLPSHIAEDLDAIRNIGNFSSHPIKSKSSGEIVKVEAGEAEWNLDVLEELFDFYFVQPEISRKKREALNEKLKDAGKPLMKEPKK